MSGRQAYRWMPLFEISFDIPLFVEFGQPPLDRRRPLSNALGHMLSSLAPDLGVDITRGVVRNASRSGREHNLKAVILD
jgi:hypothetical protein